MKTSNEVLSTWYATLAELQARDARRVLWTDHDAHVFEYLSHKLMVLTDILDDEIDEVLYEQAQKYM